MLNDMDTSCDCDDDLSSMKLRGLECIYDVAPAQRVRSHLLDTYVYFSPECKILEGVVGDVESNIVHSSSNAVIRYNKLNDASFIEIEITIRI